MDGIFRYRKKIKTVDELEHILGKPRDRKVIMCHGVFDIVHPGHVRHLIYAKSKGDILVVSITADEHITKGNVRPHIPEDLRAVNLAVFDMVDYVLIDRHATPIQNLQRLQPDYFAKGYEYSDAGVNPKTAEEMRTVRSFGGEMLFTPGDIVYSSSRLIEMAPPDIREDKLLFLMEDAGITFATLRETVKSFAGISVHVVGDSIVDTYTQCTMIGGMTKTPTMSVRYERKHDFPGGAAVVAKHLRTAQAEVVFSTVLGNDPYGEYLLQDMIASGIRCLPIVDPLRPTTQKNAIVVGAYRLLKVDTVDNRPISEKMLGILTEQIRSQPVDGIVFSDFRHGMFDPNTIPHLIGAIPQGVFRVADSQVASRWGNILDFQGFTLIAANEREARFALADQDSVIRPLGAKLLAKADANTLFLKLGDRGLIVFRQALSGRLESFFLDSFAEQVVDPVGAGDALLAYGTLAMIATNDPAIAAILGSFAAADACSHNGNTPVHPDAILAYIDRAEKRVGYR